MADIVVNIDALTFGDMEIIDRWGKGQTEFKDALDVLDRVIEGGVRSMPITRAEELMTAIYAAVDAATDEKN